MLDEDSEALWLSIETKRLRADRNVVLILDAVTSDSLPSDLSFRCSTTGAAWPRPRLASEKSGWRRQRPNGRSVWTRLRETCRRVESGARSLSVQDRGGLARPGVARR